MPREEWEKPRCRPHCLLSFETVGSFFSEKGRKEGSKGLHGEIAMERKARREGDRLDERRRQIRRKNNFPLLPFYVSLPSVRAPLF